MNSYAKAFLHVHVRSNTFGLVYLDQLLDLIKYFGKVYNLRLSNTLIYIYICTLFLLYEYTTMGLHNLNFFSMVVCMD